MLGLVVTACKASYLQIILDGDLATVARTSGALYNIEAPATLLAHNPLKGRESSHSGRDLPENGEPLQFKDRLLEYKMLILAFMSELQ